MVKHFFIGSTTRTHVQFFRYLWVGGSSAAVDLAVFSLCIYWLSVPLYVSAFVGYMFGLAWNYVLSIYWVFTSTQKTREIISVFLIALGGLFWTWLLLYIFVDLWNVSEALAKAISQVLILGWNFSLRKWVVF